MSSLDRLVCKSCSLPRRVRHWVKACTQWYVLSGTSELQIFVSYQSLPTATAPSVLHTDTLSESLAHTTQLSGKRPPAC